MRFYLACFLKNRFTFCQRTFHVHAILAQNSINSSSVYASDASIRLLFDWVVNLYQWIRFGSGWKDYSKRNEMRTRLATTVEKVYVAVSLTPPALHRVGHFVRRRQKNVGQFSVMLYRPMFTTSYIFWFLLIFAIFFNSFGKTYLL